MSNNISETPINPLIPTIPAIELDPTNELEKLGLKAEDITPELLTRFQEALRRYQSGADANLALLEERVYVNLDEEVASTTEKIAALTAWIERQESSAVGDVIAPPHDLAAATETAAAEVSETMEAMRTRMENEATTRATEALQARFGNIPFFWESIAHWLIEQWKSSIGNENSGIQGKINSIFVGLIAGIFGVQWIFDSFKVEITQARSAELPVVPQVPTIPIISPTDTETDTDTATPSLEDTPSPEDTGGAEAIAPIRPQDRHDDLGEEPLEHIEISLETRKEAYSKAGNLFFLGLATATFESGHSPQLVYPHLDNIAWGRIQEIYAIYENVPADSAEKESAYLTMVRELHIENPNLIDDKITLIWAIESIAHPDTNSIIQGRLTDEVRNTLKNDEKIKAQFWDWGQEILSKRPTEMTFEELKIALMMSFPSFIISEWMEWATLVWEMLFWRELSDDLRLLWADLQDRAQSLLPEKVVGIFLTWALNNVNIVQDNPLLYETIENSDIELNWEEQEALWKLVAFKDRVIESLNSSKFNLWFSNFGETLKANLTYSEVILLYNILNANPDISSIPEEDELLSSTIYSWIIYSLPEFWETYITKWQYIGAILQNTTTENPTLTETQISLILRQTGRGSNLFMREYFSYMQNQREWFREFSRREIADSLGINPETVSNAQLDYLEYAIIISLLWWSVAASRLKLPLPLKIAISGIMAGAWVNWGLTILYDNWKLWEIITRFQWTDVLTRLDALIKENTWYSIEELDERQRSWEPFPTST